MKNCFLETRNVTRFREAIKVVEDMEKGQPGLMLVHGKAGRGKTESCKQYTIPNPHVLFLRVMQDWTPRAMLAQLCHQINGMEPHSIEKGKRIVCEEIERYPRTIIVDEADRLRNVGMIEHFRDIHDKTGAPVVFVGEQHLYSMIQSRRRIWSRVSQVVGFERVGAEDIILFGLQAADLKIEPAAAQRIAVRSDGDFRLIWQDVRWLETMAAANKISEITMKIVDSIPLRSIGPEPDLKTSGGRNGR